MNQYKKLILSLTISLLSFTEAWSMTRSIPQIKTYREFGIFVNQYTAADFLSNKPVFGPTKPGLLKILLDSYNSIPVGARDLAENLFRSKFKMNSTQLSQKLEQLIGTTVPVSVKQAQEIIHQLTEEAQKDSNKLKQDKANLENQVKELEAGIAQLADNIQKANVMPQNIAKLKTKNTVLKQRANDLDQLNNDLINNRNALEEQLATLQAQLQTPGASTSADQKRIADLEENLNETDIKIAEYQSKKQFYKKKIQELEKQIEQLVASNHNKQAEHDKQAEYIIKEMEDIIKQYTDAGTEGLNQIILHNPSTTIGQLSNNVDSLNTITDITELKQALIAVDTFKNNSMKLHDKLKPQAIELITLAHATGDNLDNIINVLNQRLDNYSKLPSHLNIIIKAIEERIEELQPKSKIDPQTLQEMSEWTTDLAINKAQEVQQVLADPRLDPNTSNDKKSIKRALKFLENNILPAYGAVLNQYNHYKAVAQNDPALNALKSAKSTIKSIKDLLATTNNTIDALKKKQHSEESNELMANINNLIQSLNPAPSAIGFELKHQQNIKALIPFLKKQATQMELKGVEAKIKNYSDLIKEYNDLKHNAEAANNTDGIKLLSDQNHIIESMNSFIDQANQFAEALQARLKALEG